MKHIAIIFTLLLLVSCSSMYTKTRGYFLYPEDLEEIKVGLTNKDNVLNILDNPSLYSFMTDNRWIYISYKIEEKMFFKPKLVDSNVVVIDFEDDIVKNLQIIKIDKKNIKMIETETYRSGKEDKESWIKDIFNNIGSFSLSN